MAGEVRVAALEHGDDGRRAALGEALVELVGALGVRVALDRERLGEVGVGRAVAELGHERVLAARAQVARAVVEQRARGDDHVLRDRRRRAAAR